MGLHLAQNVGCSSLRSEVGDATVMLNSIRYMFGILDVARTASMGPVVLPPEDCSPLKLACGK